ncbi:hypothetical protein AB0M50_26620, partial [Nonomuraea fuscirosea]|uniref:hypothetical protein n=1 Tax=Nonomuraea fuscirosea TaxID=1291556 RepID=UPI00341CA1FF
MRRGRRTYGTGAGVIGGVIGGPIGAAAGRAAAGACVVMLAACAPAGTGTGAADSCFGLPVGPSPTLAHSSISGAPHGLSP